jgi:hypothetical protein
MNAELRARMLLGKSVREDGVRQILTVGSETVVVVDATIEVLPRLVYGPSAVSATADASGWSGLTRRRVGLAM